MRPLEPRPPTGMMHQCGAENHHERQSVFRPVWNASWGRGIGAGRVSQNCFRGKM